jgi:putative transposase
VVGISQSIPEILLLTFTGVTLAYSFQMGRVARIVIPGLPHHITQRGNRCERVFISDEDCKMYLGLLQKYAQKHSLEILAYCLMSNHVHLVAVPQKENSLGQTLHDTHTTYALRFNKREGVSGHLWQCRFYSCALDESHLWAAVRYVETNPVRAAIVRRAEDYLWSSAAAHCGRRADALVTRAHAALPEVDDWRSWLMEANEEQTALIRRKTRTGRPCGSALFVEQLEAKTNRLLRPAKRGPKPKRKGKGK